MKGKEKAPPCPRCGRRNSTKAGELWYCPFHGLHDGRPEEGGDYFTDPSKRLEKQEQRQCRQQPRR